MRKPIIFSSMSEAVADYPDGASLMLPGFGPGIPWNLLLALWEQGASDLTIMTNSIGFPSGNDRLQSMGDFVAAGRVKKVIAAFTASTRPSIEGVGERLIREGTMEAELLPQGTLAERIRAGGAGIPAFYTPASAGTPLAEAKERRTFNGREYVMEHALFADYAFIRAWKADELGNLIYRRAARNFNPIMATAAHKAIVEVEEPIVPAGELDPDHIHTSGVYIHGIVQIPPDGFIKVARVRLPGVEQVRG